MSWRILYLAPFDVTLPLGHSVHVRNLCDALESRGHEIRLVSLAPEPPAPRGWTGPKAGWERIQMGRIPMIRHVAAQEALRSAARRAFHRFDPQVVAYRVQPLSWVSAGMDAGGAVVVAESCASVAQHLQLRGRGGWKAILARSLERRALLRADRVRVVDDALGEIHMRRYGLAEDRLHVVPVGTIVPDLEAVSPHAERERWQLTPTDFLIGFAGGLDSWQGVDLVIEALGALSPEERSGLRFCLVGAGPRRRAWEDLAQARGVSKQVRFLGPLSQGDTHAFLQSAQVVVSPFRTSTLRDLGFRTHGPLKPVEGMACDRPVLASGSCPWSDEAGGSWMASPGEHVGDDTASWAAALSRWLGRWRSAGSPLTDWPWPAGQGPGRRFVLEHRSWDRVAAAWESMVEVELGRRSRG